MVELNIRILVEVLEKLVAENFGLDGLDSSFDDGADSSLLLVVVVVLRVDASQLLLNLFCVLVVRRNQFASS